MAMFVMALGIVGVMTLFPVGLGSVNTAMDATMTDIIGRAGFAQMQVYMNTSEIFDCGSGRPRSGATGEYWAWVRYRYPSRSCPIRAVDYTRNQLQYFEIWMCSVAAPQNLDGYYLRFVKGVAAGQIRRIQTASSYTVTIDGSYPAPLNRLPSQLAPNSSKVIVTRYGFPMIWKPMRLARVRSISGNSVTPESINGDVDELGWGGGEWNGGSYFILFTSGRGKGRLLRIAGGGGGGLRITTGSIDLATGDGVALGDTFVVLGCAELRPCVFPANISNILGFNETRFDDRFQTPPVIPYYTSPRTYQSKMANEPEPAEYSYLCIISTADTPQPPYQDIGSAKSARVDVVVFRNFEMQEREGTLWKTLEEQPRAIGFFTGFVSPL